MTKIQCPFCATTTDEGFDCVAEHDNHESDDYVRSVYQCPVCGKKCVRCYEFYAWENIDGDEIEKDDIVWVKKKATPKPKTPRKKSRTSVN